MKILPKILFSILIPMIVTIALWAFLTNHQAKDSARKDEKTATVSKDQVNRRETGLGTKDMRRLLPRAKMSQMDRRIASLEQKVGSSVEGNPNGSVTTEPDPLAEMENVRQVIRQKREETIARIFASDEHDYEWEDNMSSQIKQLLAKSDFSSSALVDMDCRQSLCRIVFTHKDEAARDSFSMDFVPNAPPHSHIWGRPFYDDVKGYGTELYLTRNGYAVFSESDKVAKASLE